MLQNDEAHHPGEAKRRAHTMDKKRHTVGRGGGGGGRKVINLGSFNRFHNAHLALDGVRKCTYVVVKGIAQQSFYGIEPGEVWFLGSCPEMGHLLRCGPTQNGPKKQK